ncbi:MAG: polysaccharide deacetylase family protein [Paraclostridium sp.]
MVYLTFDDGPSTTNTPDVLDILKEENVKATFFIAGENAEGGGESSKKLIKRVFDEGNAIANHSWSHDYKVLYPNRILNLDNFKEDFKKTDEFLKDVLGDNFSTNVLRCPGGYMSWKEMEPLDNYLEQSNKSSIDWNALNKDAEGAKKNSYQLVNEAINTASGKEMVVLLMHDTYGKEETVKALPEIIKHFKENGYEFRTLV